MWMSLIALSESEKDLEEEANHPTLTSSWQESVTSLTISKPNVRYLKLSIGGTPAGGGNAGCVVFDDVVLAKR